jgi:Family of unknown function (DUF5908)
MPLEIRELVIKTAIEGDGKAAQANQAGGANGGGQAAIVAACVEQVLAILKDKAER